MNNIKTYYTKPCNRSTANISYADPLSGVCFTTDPPNTWPQDVQDRYYSDMKGIGSCGTYVPTPIKEIHSDEDITNSLKILSADLDISSIIIVGTTPTEESLGCLCRSISHDILSDVSNEIMLIDNTIKITISGNHTSKVATLLSHVMKLQCIGLNTVMKRIRYEHKTLFIYF